MDLMLRMKWPYHDQIVGITATELEKPDRLRQSFLCLKLHVQALSEVRFGTHRLKDKDTKSHDSLLGWLISVFHSIEDA